MNSELPLYDLGNQSKRFSDLLIRTEAPEALLRCEIRQDDDIPNLKNEGMIEEACQESLVVVIEYVLEQLHSIVLEKGLDYVVFADLGIEEDGRDRDLKVS